MPISNNPGGYSWLGVSVPKTSSQRKKTDREELKSLSLSFENKIHQYNALCKKYKKYAETEDMSKVLQQMKELEQEMDSMLQKMSKTLDESMASFQKMKKKRKEE